MYKVYPLIQIRQEEKIVNKITGQSGLRHVVKQKATDQAS
jgi:hypothetical protein